MADLAELFDAACSQISDIFEHLPLLSELAGTCSHITELSMNGEPNSALAFLMAQPATLISYKSPLNSLKKVKELIPLRGKTIFIAYPYSASVVIKPTDFLFIDTLHTYGQLKEELESFHTQVTSYIAIHDTTTFGNKGEDGSHPGLLQAVYEFIDQENQWKIIHHTQNNNGLIILERDEVQGNVGDRIYTMAHFDLPDIRWVERFIVGSTHPERELTQKEIEWQMERVNKALRYGRITGVERNFVLIEVGRKTVTTSYLVYHIGFKSRPAGK